MIDVVSSQPTADVSSTYSQVSVVVDSTPSVSVSNADQSVSVSLISEALVSASIDSVVTSEWVPETVWMYLVTTWTVEPSLVATTASASIYSYTLNGTTRYRSVPLTYDATLDAFYSTYSSGVLSGFIVARG